MIVIVIGLPGSGKSYFASRFAGLLEAEYINSDIVRKQLLKQKNYSENEKLSVYDAMLKKMKELIRQKVSVVLDATFYRSTIREKFLKEANGKDIVYFIEVKASIPLTRERLKKQRPDSDADYEVYKIIKQQFEPLQEDHLLLRSTNDNINDMLQKASNYLHVKDDKRANR